MTTMLRATLALPKHFCTAVMLAFHRRDAQHIAERVNDQQIHKAIVWRGMSACLSLKFGADSVAAQLAIDGVASEEGLPELIAMVQRMLGLTQNIEQFEAQYRNHPQIGAIICRQSGLRVPLSPTPFEALTWAITGQQISVSAAVSIRRKLIIAAAMPHSSGLLCYPTAAQVAQLGENTLRQAGFSHTKTQTLLTLSEQVIRQQLPLDDWSNVLDVAQITAALAAVRGIGPWTINYTLLRGYGWLDGSLHGDVAVRRGLQTLLGQTSAITEKEAQNYMAQFSPWRALLGAHLWHRQSATSN